MANLSPARKAAFVILMAVERDRAHADDLLRDKAVSALSPLDRNLVTAMVLGVLRWQIRLDYQIRALLTHPNAKLDPEILILLRLGAFQILHMDRIPARAAIDESVELAKQAGQQFASGMVNAVLRRLSEAPHASFPDQSPAALALAQAHPAWVVERWVGHYGMEAARAFCHHDQNQPTLTLHIANPAVQAELTLAGIRLEPGELLTAARKVVSGDVTASAAVREGRTWLQDEGSQLVAELAGRGNWLLDCCAAPGGKTLVLAERKARILACEISPPRWDELRKRMAVFTSRIQCRLTDANVLVDGGFDVALADVPCSGTGTLGRNPEIRLRLNPEDFSRHADRQLDLLLAAVRAVHPGGHVIYSTCSMESEENEQVVALALARNPNTRTVSLGGRIEALLAEGILTPGGAQRLNSCLTPEGALRLLPGQFHTDGFFIAMVERIA
jgi:16S rRNA (cytosine967-C5)-methyltransferase